MKKNIKIEITDEDIDAIAKVTNFMDDIIEAVKNVIETGYKIEITPDMIVFINYLNTKFDSFKEKIINKSIFEDKKIVEIKEEEE